MSLLLTKCHACYGQRHIEFHSLRKLALIVSNDWCTCWVDLSSQLAYLLLLVVKQLTHRGHCHLKSLEYLFLLKLLLVELFELAKGVVGYGKTTICRALVCSLGHGRL